MGDEEDWFKMVSQSQNVCPVVKKVFYVDMGLVQLVCCICAQMFRGSILVGGRSVINGGYPILFLHLGIDGVTIKWYSSIQVVLTRPALNKKTLP